MLDEGIRALRDRGFNATGQLAIGEPVKERAWGPISSSSATTRTPRSPRAGGKGSVGASLLDYATCSILIAMSRG